MDRLLKKALKLKAGSKLETCERMHLGNDLLPRRYLLNRRQCEDLSTKLRKMTENVRSLVEGIDLPNENLELALEDFYRYFEKGKMLLMNCVERTWWRAAVFQWQNENAFREILLDISLSYHLFYEEVNSHRGIFRGVFETSPNDFPVCSKFEPPSADDVRKDEKDLLSLLEKLVNDYKSIESEYCPTSKELPLAQSLARYLLLRMRWASEQSLASQMEKCRAIMWHLDCPGTWRNTSYLSGAGSSVVSGWRSEWFGIHCFKKQFHAEGEGFEKVFFKEAAIMAHLKHPNIIQFFCWGNACTEEERRKEEESVHFIAMELMDKNLLKLIEDQKGVSFSLEVTLDIFWQIARGMCYLHDQGIAHRDLKPQNVMVNKLTLKHSKGYWHVKLIDYGSSKTEVEIEKSHTITQFGIGTGVYRAPEVLKIGGLKSRLKSRGKAMWLKADVFSFAMTCVHVLTLHQPFKDIGSYSPEYLYDEVMNGKRPSLPNNCPEELCVLLRSCWNVIPSKRPTFVDICLRLETLKHGTRPSNVKKEKIQSSIDFVYKKLDGESSHFKSLPKVIFAEDIDEDENKPSQIVSIISCTCNQRLDFFEKSPYKGVSRCNMCGEVIEGGLYNCSACQFDAHPHCAQIQEKVRVLFHCHPLQLLTQNYYRNNPKAKCSFCEEPTQNSDWVYRCEGCDYDVHARCTKFENNRRWPNHKHPLTVRSCPPSKSILCNRCNGEIEERTWHYYCGPCAFSMHLSCAIRPLRPICVIEESHRLDLVYHSMIFFCAFCHTQGHSQFYRCEHCKIDIHPDCVDYMDDEAYNLVEAHKKVMMEKDNKSIYAQTILISAVLDNMSSFHGSKGLSTQRPRSVVKDVHARVRELQTSKQSHESVDSANDMNQQKIVISIQTAERIKANKLAVKKV